MSINENTTTPTIENVSHIITYKECYTLIRKRHSFLWIKEKENEAEEFFCIC